MWNIYFPVSTLSSSYCYYLQYLAFFCAAIADGDMENENKKKKGKKGKKMTDEERMKKKRALLLGGDSDAEEPTSQPPSLVPC